MLWAAWKVAEALLLVVVFPVSFTETLNMSSLYCIHIDSQCESLKGDEA